MQKQNVRIKSQRNQKTTKLQSTLSDVDDDDATDDGGSWGGDRGIRTYTQSEWMEERKEERERETAENGIHPVKQKWRWSWCKTSDNKQQK